MITIVPDYYFDFHCVANKCRRSCCVGWEVGIDSESLAKYKADGIKHIVEDGDTPHFELTADLRCPYLNSSNLCDLFIKYGEDYLCQICTDHPRYRNFWTGITEIGLGLSCEECARIILSGKEPLHLVAFQSNTEINEIVLTLPEDELYLWQVREDLLHQAAAIADPMTARLTEYLIFRHIADALYDDRLEKRIAFVQYCVSLVLDAWDESEDQSDETLFEIARQFSADIEYNETRKNELIESM